MIDDLALDSAGCELVEEVLRSSGRLRLKVNGSSMLPAIWPGDVLRVVREGVEQLSPGDVVLFGREGGLVAHRIVKIKRQGTGVRRAKSEVRSPNPESRVPSPEPRVEFVTRGDSLPDADRPDLPADEVLGRVESVERDGRRFKLAQTAGGRAVAWLCAHSDFAMRVVLKAHFEPRRSAGD